MTWMMREGQDGVTDEDGHDNKEGHGVVEGVEEQDKGDEDGIVERGEAAVVSGGAVFVGSITEPSLCKETTPCHVH